ncbi:MAG: hypothetical protein KDB61_13880, partial [Planctomycetes bacterium]|nr:hypothetical protein [Planctomycetota bacterium]
GVAANQPSAGSANLQRGWTQLNRIVPLKEALEAPEKAILIQALEATRGNRKRAAEELDINRTTLFNKMRKYGLMDRDFSGETAH